MTEHQKDRLRSLSSRVQYHRQFTNSKRLPKALWDEAIELADSIDPKDIAIVMDTTDTIFKRKIYEQRKKSDTSKFVPLDVPNKSKQAKSKPIRSNDKKKNNVVEVELPHGVIIRIYP